MQLYFTWGRCQRKMAAMHLTKEEWIARLKKGVKRYRDLSRQTEEAHRELVADMGAAKCDGVPQVTIIKITDWSREHVRHLIKRSAAAPRGVSRT